MQQTKYGEATGSPAIKNDPVPALWSIHAGHRSGSTGMKRSPFFIGMVFLLLLLLTGITSADTGAGSTNTTTVTTTTAQRPGGCVYFETYPDGATVWLDNINIGTSAFTYFSEKTGTIDVLVRKKGYEDYAGNVSIVDGKRVMFYARLTQVSYNLNDTKTPTIPVTTATTVWKSTMRIPTPWPTSTPESPVDPAVVLGAIAIGMGSFVLWRR
ncbi:MAG: PEGA domain-containing protein [Methanoregula sp.]